MSEEQAPQDAAALAEAAGLVSGQAEALTTQIALLRTEVHDARVQADKDIDEARKKAAEEVAAERRDRRRAGVKFAVVILLDVVLSGVSLGLYVSQRDTNHRLETLLRQNYTTSRQQAETRIRVLCPLYEVLLAAATNPAPQATATPEQKARLATALATIRDGYTTLGCQPPLKSG